jgi:hypothetical protein
VQQLDRARQLADRFAHDACFQQKVIEMLGAQAKDYFTDPYKLSELLANIGVGALTGAAGAWAESAQGADKLAKLFNLLDDFAPNRAAETAARRGIPQKIGAMDPDVMARWTRFLERRGVTVEAGTDVAQLKLFDYGGAEGLYQSGPLGRRVFLEANPTRSAFFEESFHALDDLRELDPALWESSAKEALIRYRHRLGIPNSETRVTIQQLREVRNGTY